MPESNPPKKLSIVVASGTFEKVHYALVMATGAAAIGIPVTLFFTMGACSAIMADDGWRKLPSEKPDMTASDRDDQFKERGVATMDELIESAQELGIGFMVCEMGLRAEGLENHAMRDGFEITRTGVVTFINDADADGAIIYV